jgi:hypothetical protein
MKIIYKTVSIDTFLRGDGRQWKSNAVAPKKGMGVLDQVFASEETFAANMIEILDFLLNFYGEDGWEYWQIVELSTPGIKSAGAKAIQGLIGNLTTNSDGSSNPDSRKYPIIIFRKSVDDEEYRQYKNSLAEKKGQPNVTNDNPSLLPPANAPKIQTNNIADFPESIQGLSYKKIKARGTDTMHFIDDTFGVVHNGSLYIFGAINSLEKALENLNDYGQFAEVGVVKKIRLE